MNGWPAAARLIMSLGAVACLAAEPEGKDADDATPDDQASVAEILDNPLADDDYREERSCLWRREVDRVEIIDESIIVFRGRIKKRVWANRLSQPCVGLRPDMVVTTRARTGSICRLDAIDARPRGARVLSNPRSDATSAASKPSTKCRSRRSSGRSTNTPSPPSNRLLYRYAPAWMS